ncbi:MAG TPA: hypothetical protein VEI49_11165 [Terriglobales bacterium]|nr:hypothetical protein [Terriglobales bacterium]HXY16029.1 hypothetical protein [Terriglobales bacterium]
MEALINFVTVVAGMSLSLSIGLLMEELIFGKVFCPLFARQAARLKSGQKS